MLAETMDTLDEIERLFTEGVKEAGERTRKAEYSVENVKKADRVYLLEENTEIFEKNETVSQEIIDRTLNSFEIDMPGDYVHVQKMVMKTLVNEGFFTNKTERSRTDINEESGMVIETNKSGIDETFSLKNYARLGIKKKVIKLLTVRHLPEIIRSGRLVADNVPNQYKNSENKNFAYIEYIGEIEGIQIALQIDIKKSPQKNKFWVHKIVATENASDFPASIKNDTEAGHSTAGDKDIIHQNEAIVNRKLSISEEISEENSSDTAYFSAVEHGVGTGVLDRPKKKGRERKKERPEIGALLAYFVW